MVGKVMRKWWWWLMKKQPSLSSRNTLGDSSHNSNNHIYNGDQNGLGCGSRWWLCGWCGGGPRKTFQILENLMESNGVQTYQAEIFQLEAEIDDFGGKIWWISWMEGGETWREARSTRNQANPWIKISKTSSNQQITKKIGAIFGGDFLNLGQNQQN